MAGIDTTQFVDLFAHDNELLDALDKWDSNLPSLYVSQLPRLERFLHNLPEDLTMDELESGLRTMPVQLRLLFALRFTQFTERLNAGYKHPVYRTIREFLIAEFIENNPERINWAD